MLDEQAESDEHVTSKSPESSGNWTLLHNRDESKKPENWFCWRKDTSVKTEMYTKAIMFFPKMLPQRVAKAMSIKMNEELKVMTSKGKEACELLDKGSNEAVIFMRRSVKDQQDRDTVSKIFSTTDGIVLPNHKKKDGTVIKLACAGRFSVNHDKKPEG